MQPPSTETLDSSLNKFQRYNALPENVVHSFASKANDSCALLEELIDTTNTISNSLSAYSSVDWTNPKLISVLRQSSSIAQTLYTSENQSCQIIAALRDRANVSYGESIPLIPVQIPDWCIARLESYCKLAGLETFKDDNRESDVTTIVLGGKVLVVDIDFTFDRRNPIRPLVNVSRVKTSYAIQTTQPSGPSNALGSSTLDSFLLNTIQGFCVEVEKEEDVRDLQKATQLGKDVLQQLLYLVMLDHLAQRQDDGGLKWFIGLDEVYSTLKSFAKNEAAVVASSLLQPQAPLDIFLRRSHALPLPYLVSPSLSFLVYLSPPAYLSILRGSSSDPGKGNNTNPLQIDIALPHLRASLSSLPQGATVVTLLLSPVSSPSSTSSMHVSTFASRPTFSLAPTGADIDYAFPRLADTIMIPNDNRSIQYEWVLDFTNNGRGPGIVMSQSRMREVELVLNPLGGGMSSMDVMSSLHTFEGDSWVDLLLHTERGKTSEFYTATYTSAVLAHPPLKLRLTSPEEPGFTLERVPVHSVKEVWGILEIVREQCWLNEILVGCDWKAEEPILSDASESESDTSGVDLHAILSGSYSSQILPVNVYLPHQNTTTDSLFDPLSVSTAHRPKIVMTSPERPPITGMVEITISFDETKQRGIAVDVRGAVGADIKLDVLEEACRRGGAFGLPGRIWCRSHNISQ